jgi:subtilisin family serine protease
MLAVLLSVLPTAWAQPPAGTFVPGSFICRVGDSEDALAVGQAAVEATGGTLTYVYNTVNAFCIQVPPGIAIANLRTQRGVVDVEYDLVFHTCAQTVPTGVDRIDAEGVSAVLIDCRRVGIAIIDTGIDLDHPDLNVDAVNGIHYYTQGFRLRSDNTFDDDNGHGTHCAGIAAAMNNDMGVVGVAPGARLYAVKVLNSQGSGSLSAIAAGIDWVTSHAAGFDPPIQVANMSLGGQGTSTLLYEAMSKCPVTFSVSAGNNHADVYGPDGVYGGGDDYIPAAYGGVLDNVLTISAMADSDGKPGGAGGPTSYGPDDSFASFSNYSKKGAIAYLLPGVDILSTYMGGGTATMSGTSMAAPHAAGLLALDIAAPGSFIAVAQDSSDGLSVKNDPDSHWENLGYSIYPAGSSGNIAPTAMFTFTVDGLSASFNASASWDSDGSIVSYDWSFGDGASGSGVTVTHTYAVAGTYAVTLTVTDDGGASGILSKSVTVTDPGSGGTIVLSLTSSASRVNSQKWTAMVTATVKDGDGNLVEGATVAGNWVELGIFASKLTDASGTCVFNSGNIGKKIPSVTFKADATYGDATDTESIVVKQP